MIVVGERGHVLVSTDGGASWQQAEVPTRVLLTAVHMHDERTGWAVGHDAVILRTVDGGESWTLVHQAPEEELPLLDVWFRDERTGFAVGAYGYFLATEDGGDTWVSRAIGEDDFHLNALVPVMESGPGAQRPWSQRLYVAAEAGAVYRSDDGGTTWRELPSPYSGSWFGGLALDGHQVLLTGLRGHLFRSEDAGETWTEVTTGTHATLNGAVRLPSGSIVITGLEGKRADQRGRRSHRVGPAGFRRARGSRPRCPSATAGCCWSESSVSVGSRRLNSPRLPAASFPGRRCGKRAPRIPAPTGSARVVFRHAPRGPSLPTPRGSWTGPNRDLNATHVTRAFEETT